jgi:hypothetical protein
MVATGAKTFTIQVGQSLEIISENRLKAHTGSSLVSPAMAASHGHTPKKPAGPTIQSATS